MKKQARKMVESRYSHLYRLAPCERMEVGWPLCVYCGQPADSVDHVPPLSRVDDYRALRPAEEHYLLVKSCMPCNTILGDSVQTDVLARIDYLKMRLRAKKKTTHAADLWTEEDIEEVGKNLRSLINSSIRKTSRLEQRIEYKGGIRALLGYFAE